jgi:hypothetical protein
MGLSVKLVSCKADYCVVSEVRDIKENRVC